LKENKIPRRLRHAAGGRIGKQMLTRHGLKGFLTLVMYAQIVNQKYDMSHTEAVDDVFAEIEVWAANNPNSWLNSWSLVGWAMFDRPQVSKVVHIQNIEIIKHHVCDFEYCVDESLMADRAGLRLAMNNRVSADELRMAIKHIERTTGNVVSSWLDFVKFKNEQLGHPVTY
ncbi:unnamed protein product, partial [marine sediment metagenome]